MLKSINFSIFTCQECGEQIRVEPGVPVAPLLHDCKKSKPVAEKQDPKRNRTKSE